MYACMTLVGFNTSDEGKNQWPSLGFPLPKCGPGNGEVVLRTCESFLCGK